MLVVSDRGGWVRLLPCRNNELCYGGNWLVAIRSCALAAFVL